MSKPTAYALMTGGAGNEVTGSNSILRICVNDKIHYGALDVGIKQGKSEYKNFDYPVNARMLEFVIITHWHADHIHGIPLLKGFKGKIYGTLSTLKNGKEQLYNSAFVNERKAAEEHGFSFEMYQELCSQLERMRRRNNSKERRTYIERLNIVKSIRADALFTREDVDNIVKRFSPIIPYQDLNIADGVNIRAIPTPHLDGAVSIEMYIGDYGEDSINISFSGDIGPKDSFLYKNYDHPQNYLINFCVMEALHGVEERKQTAEEAFEEVKHIILKGILKNKTVILTGFSPNFVYAINRLIDETSLSVPIYFDAPLAYKILLNYQADYNDNNSRNFWFKNLDSNPFDMSEFIVTNKYRDHLEAMRDDSPKVIITTSPFGDGGRIMDYFKRYIQDEDAVFVFASWLNANCSSNILHTARKGELIEIHGSRYVKHCETHQISGFTGHGYLPEFIEYIERFPMLKGIILNHADNESKKAVAEYITKKYGVEVLMPEMYDASSNNILKFDASGVTYIPTAEGYRLFNKVLR